MLLLTELVKNKILFQPYVQFLCLLQWFIAGHPCVMLSPTKTLLLCQPRFGQYISQVAAAAEVYSEERDPLPMLNKKVLLQRSSKNTISNYNRLRKFFYCKFQSSKQWKILTWNNNHGSSNKPRIGNQEEYHQIHRILFQIVWGRVPM